MKSNWSSTTRTMAANLTAPDEQQIAARLLEAVTIAEWAEGVIDELGIEIMHCPEVDGFLGYDRSEDWEHG